MAWCEIEQGISEIFASTKIKFVLCKGMIAYAKIEDRDQIFAEFHTSPLGGHGGVKRTMEKIKQYYYWEKMHEDITNRIRRCLPCQLQKFRRESAKHPMIITDQPRESFEKYALDICGPFPVTSKGNTCILTMQCLFSRYVIMVPIPDQTAETVTEEFIKKLVCIFGCPQKILTDLGQNFMSKIFKRITKKFGINKCSTIAYRPQTSAVKELRPSLNEFLRFYTYQDTEWDTSI